MNAKFILFLSCFAAMTLIASAVNAAPRGGGGHGGHGGHGGYHGGHGGHFSSISPRGGHGAYYGGHGGHFSSISPRGGHKFGRSGSTFSHGRSGTYRNWSGGNWGGRNWGGGDRFVFIGGFGYPYYWDWYPSWGWGIPYAFNYGYYSSGYYPSYGYGFDYPYYWDWYPSWGWGIPYAFNYGYYSSGYNPSHRYDYDRYSDPAYGYADRSSIAQLQRRLARAGYYYGAIDGIMGRQTRRAIRAYERAYVALSMR
jgi:hypothetical protein